LLTFFRQHFSSRSPTGRNCVAVDTNLNDSDLSIPGRRSAAKLLSKDEARRISMTHLRFHQNT
jgi:hypothetical protein